jgi:glycosyltransferase involved in cell wall biosynthesis
MAELTRVLIPIAEPIGGQMSARGIRQFEVGKALAAHCDVTFASSADHNDEQQGVSIARCRSRAQFRALLKRHDVLYTLGLNSDRFLDVVRSGICVVLDIYTPLAYEILESWPEVPASLLSQMHRRVVKWTNAQLALADFIICTNEKQRDMWLGVLNAIGRVTADASRRNPNLRELIDVSPFGIPEQPPARNGRPLRALIPQLGSDDFILIWSSKILAWQDPVTLLRAMHLLQKDEPRIRLVFLGIGPIPQPGKPGLFDPASLRTREAIQTAAELGLAGSSVFFLTERIPYREIGSFYLDADAAVATYPDSLETRFCLGSRILDYVWAGLPMVVSGDDLQRQFVEDQRLGIGVRPGDPVALADAIRRLKANVTGNGVNRLDFKSAQDRLRWSAVTRPIISFCMLSASRGGLKRNVLAARLQLIEFVARSLLIRAHMMLAGIRKA